MNKIEYYENDKHRATLSYHEHSTIDEVVEEFRLLAKVMGFTDEQVIEAMPTEEYLSNLN